MFWDLILAIIQEDENMPKTFWLIVNSRKLFLVMVNSKFTINDRFTKHYSRLNYLKNVIVNKIFMVNILVKYSICFKHFSLFIVILYKLKPLELNSLSVDIK